MTPLRILALLATTCGCTLKVHPVGVPTALELCRREMPNEHVLGGVLQVVGVDGDIERRCFYYPKASRKPCEAADDGAACAL